MDGQYWPYILPLLIATVITLAGAVYVWRHRSVTGGVVFVWLLLAIAVWSFAYVFEIVAPGVPTKVLWAKVEYLGIASVPALWLIFALQYTGRENWLTRRNLFLLGIVPLITLALVWTNEIHRLIWIDYDVHNDTLPVLHIHDYGIWFWVHWLFSYVYMLVGSVLLVWMLFRSPHLYRRQIGVLLIGTLTPWLGNALYIFKLNPLAPYDLTPLAFTISGLALIWGLFRLRLLDVTPIAYSAVIAGMSDGMIVLDAHNRVVALNPAAGVILNIEASKVVGLPAGQVFSQWAGLVERYRDVTLAQAEITLGEGDTQRDYDLRISPLADQRKRFIGRVIVLRDITDRKRAEEQVRAAEERYRTVVEQVPAIVYIDAVDETSSAIYMSPQVKAILNYTPEEWIADPGLWIKLIHPDDRERVLAEHERTNQTGEPFEMDYRLVARDGRVVWIRDEALLVRDKAGQPLYWQGILIDITARRQSEQQLRLANTAIESTANAIVITDQKGNFIWVNPAFTRLTGYTAEEAVGNNPRLLNSGQHDQAFYKDLWDTVLSGRVWHGEMINRRKDGSLYTEEQIITPVFDESSHITHFIAVKQDITERKRAEAELRSQKQLFENLVAVARATVERPTLEDTLQNALNVAVLLTRAEAGSLFLLDGSGAVTRSILTRSDVDQRQRQEIIGQVMEGGLAGWVYRSKQAALITDTSVDERWKTLPDQPYEVRAALSVPILSGSAVTGILTLLDSHRDHFTVEHAELMQAAVDQMALAVRNAQIFDELRQMADRQITLYETLRRLSGQLDLQAVIRTAVDAIIEFVGWTSVVVALPSQDDTHWTISTSTGELLPNLELTYPIDHGVIGRAFTTLMTQRVLDVREDPDYIAIYPSTRSELAVPIRRGDHTLGVLSVESSQVAAFDADDVLLAESLAEAIGLAMDNAASFQATQQERSRLQSLITSSRDGIIFISLDRYIRVINEPALLLLRMPGRPSNWVDHPLREALGQLRHTAPVAVKATLAEMRRIQTGNEPPGEGEYEIPPRVIRWVTLPVIVGERPVGRLVVLRNVTEERAVERLREDVTRTMVHDLRNPLTSIVTSLGLLTQGVMGEIPQQQATVLQIAEGSAKRMKELVNSILDVSRLESGRMPVEPEAFALASIVAEILQLQAPFAKEKNLRLENAAPFTLPPAWADAGLIRRVLQNLVGNAVKFTSEGGVVRVEAWTEERKGRSLILVSVSDNGPGIPTEVKSQLFQKFVTGHQEGRGSGLGLAFCKLAIEAHGEHIWVESEPGRGTTFMFSLPTLPADGLV